MTIWQHDSKLSLPVYRQYGGIEASIPPQGLQQRSSAHKHGLRIHLDATRAFLALCVIAALGLVLVIQGRRLPSVDGPPSNRSISSVASSAAGSSSHLPAPDFPAAHLKNLVLVAGHAVYTGVDYHLANKESSWFLEEYQQVSGEAQSFLDHIRLGIEAAASDPDALLLFSGGQTRRAAGPRSEGLSYWVVAEAAEWYGHPDVRARAYTEEHARDSFENLLFSLCRFYELTGHYPSNITAVSYTLKQRRFEDVHRAAVRFPHEHFYFIGTPVPPAAKGAEAGEASTVAAFMKDPYGCTCKLLEKKSKRDPFAVGPIHPSRCPGMTELLGHCSSSTFKGHVPWAA